MIVLQAARSGAHASTSGNTHVEVAAEAAAKLKQCCSHVRLEDYSASAADQKAAGNEQVNTQSAI